MAKLPSPIIGPILYLVFSSGGASIAASAIYHEIAWLVDTTYDSVWVGRLFHRVICLWMILMRHHHHSPNVRGSLELCNKILAFACKVSRIMDFAIENVHMVKVRALIKMGSGRRYTS